MRLPKLSTLFSYVEKLSDSQRNSMIEYLQSLNNDRQKMLSDVENEVNSDWEEIVGAKPFTIEINKPNNISISFLFYEAIKTYEGVVCRQVIFQYIKSKSNFSDSYIFKFIDSESKKLGVKKTRKSSVWKFETNQVALPF